MSDTIAVPESHRARPVSLFTIVFVFVLFGAAVFIARYAYAPATVAPQNDAAENLPKDLDWRATSELRRKALTNLQTEQQRELSGYGWVDRSAGVVQLPIEQAMKLTVEKHGARK